MSAGGPHAICVGARGDHRSGTAGGEIQQSPRVQRGPRGFPQRPDYKRSRRPRTISTSGDETTHREPETVTRGAVMRWGLVVWARDGGRRPGHKGRDEQPPARETGPARRVTQTPRRTSGLACRWTAGIVAAQRRMASGKKARRTQVYMFGGDGEIAVRRGLVAVGTRQHRCAVLKSRFAELHAHHHRCRQAGTESRPDAVTHQQERHGPWRRPDAPIDAGLCGGRRP